MEIAGLHLLGWLASLAVGFVIGGVLFMSIKAQVDYVVKKKGPEWILPAAMFARLLFVAALLVMLLLWVPRDKLAPVVLAGVVGTLVARILIARMVKREAKETDAEATEEAEEEDEAGD